MRTLFLSFFSTILLHAATYTVKAGGGGTFTTIQACATAMSAGDTCTVYAGTYNENVTTKAGTAGNYMTFNVNGADVVNVLSFTLNSYNKIIGFTITNPSSPNHHDCITISPSVTSIYITNNIITQCGNGGATGGQMISTSNGSGADHVYVQGNTFSWACGTPSAPDACNVINIFGHHYLLENNDMSHMLFGVDASSQYTVIRNNKFHDLNQTECTTAPTCHMDVIFSEPGTTFPVQYNLWENNTSINALGSYSKGFFVSGDVCGGSCKNVIERFNTFAHLGSGAVAQTSGFTYVKVYNNTFVDLLNYYVGQFYEIANIHYNTAPNGADINNLFYFPEAVPAAQGWVAYYSAADSLTGFTAGSNLAWCTLSPCAPQGGNYQSFTAAAPGNQIADPKFNNYAGNDFSLVPGSPALNGGTYLTTVANTDTGSGTSLVVTDASFFQDGLGLSAVGVNADCISVTTVTSHVCVTAVNYSTNTLTLTTSITRSAGDPVWLYSDSTGRQVLTGNAPNIGAFAPTIAPPTNLITVVQ